MTDSEILSLYSQWGEEYYCAGFLSPSSEAVKDFRQWLNDPRKLYLKPVQYDYEKEMLEEFHKQEEEEPVRNANIKYWRTIHDRT